MARGAPFEEYEHGQNQDDRCQAKASEPGAQTAPPPVEWVEKGYQGSGKMSRPREVSITYTFPSPGTRMPMAPS